MFLSVCDFLEFFVVLKFNAKFISLKTFIQVTEIFIYAVFGMVRIFEVTVVISAAECQ
jgi:hypothetical protein